MEIDSLVVGTLQVNCYLAWCPASKETIIIDPGGDADDIIKRIGRLGLKAIAIVNTHAHGDHIAANEFLMESLQIPLWVHEKETPLLADPLLNASAYYGLPVISPPADRFLTEGEQVVFGQCSLRVIETPGHSPGGISLHADGSVFAGDALFAGSIGRCDIPGSNMAQLLESIRKKLFVLPDSTVVYPGHGSTTTIGQEKRLNPYVGEHPLP